MKKDDRVRLIPFLPLFTLCLLTAPALAQAPAEGEGSGNQPPEQAQAERNTQEPAKEDAAGIFSLLPADVTTDHVLQTKAGPLAYTATAGTLSLRGQDGKVTAKIFYTAYRARDRAPGRPITFAFNGGPGAASAYLHLGLVGPKILPFSGDNADGTQPVLKDNPESWLAFTDLVLIDPVGTGWSRAANEEAASRFYGVRQDAESLAKAVTLYVQANDLLSAPKYLLGESYGGFRAAKVAIALKNSQNMIPSGIIMVSPLMEGRFLFGADDDPLAAALQLPSLGAAELERKGQFDVKSLADAESFAMGEYLTTLAGAEPQGERAKGFYGRIAQLTGVPADVAARTRGFVGNVYAKQAAGAGHIVSPYDAGIALPDAYPEAPYGRNDDPVLEGYTRAYGSAFAAYAREILGFRTDMTYTLLNEEINRKWEWNGGRGSENNRVTAGISTDLRDLFSVIPSFRLMVAHGYSDILTPYGMSRYVLNHLPADLVTDRASLKLYRGGHMFYTRDDDRRAMFEDARAFYEVGKAGN
ncbi:S10 family peptidase [Rhizobium sp. SGZ-381]|uniref:S10 family peptidase n=1 Tax=Rhizobium sp. SGZ-381 TaxID=3342800 RepID=UPI003671C343